MKKALALLLAACMSLALVACGGGDGSTSGSTPGGSASTSQGATSATGEATAVWIMMILLHVASVLAILMSVYVIAQYKKQFGESAMKPMKD